MVYTDPDGNFWFITPQICFGKGGFSLGIEIGIGFKGFASISVSAGYNFKNDQGYWSAQGAAFGFYAGYGSSGWFAGVGYGHQGSGLGIGGGYSQAGGWNLGINFGGGIGNLSGGAGIGWSQKGGFDWNLAGGYTQFLGKRVSETAFIAPAEVSNALDATDSNLGRVVTEGGFGDYKKRLNVSELTTENLTNLPNGFYVKDGFIYKSDGTQLGGLTIAGGNKSRILMSPGIFEYGAYSVFSNTGHEFVHAYHNFMRLGNSDFTEAVAYKWQATVAKAYGQASRAISYSQIANQYGLSSVPKSYNLPSWFPKIFK